MTAGAGAGAARLEIPAGVGAGVAARLAEHATSAFPALGVAGYGRADVRIAADGRIWFLEMNPPPALGEPDLFAAAAALGWTRRG